MHCPRRTSLVALWLICRPGWPRSPYRAWLAIVAHTYGPRGAPQCYGSVGLAGHAGQAATDTGGTPAPSVPKRHLWFISPALEARLGNRPLFKQRKYDAKQRSWGTGRRNRVCRAPQEAYARHSRPCRDPRGLPRASLARHNRGAAALWAWPTRVAG
jgi:hypothetical protein